MKRQAAGYGFREEVERRSASCKVSMSFFQSLGILDLPMVIIDMIKVHGVTLDSFRNAPSRVSTITFIVLGSFHSLVPS
jgi:hypothetical protein